MHHERRQFACGGSGGHYDDDDDTILYFDVLHQQPNGQLQIQHRRNIIK
jgi:hypothetical protein